MARFGLNNAVFKLVVLPFKKTRGEEGKDRGKANNNNNKRISGLLPNDRP